jgi:alkanesulfonate monooxygenase SsuD/methylene tetrahydromethanopterin reductase-like flavin-dependent oxidoreductase (luciferase family)
VEGYRESLYPHELATIDAMRAVRAVGGPETVRREITAFIERTGADELILGGSIYDQGARHRSLRLVAEALS